MHTESWLRAKWLISFLDVGSTKLHLWTERLGLWKCETGWLRVGLFSRPITKCDPTLSYPLNQLQGKGQWATHVSDLTFLLQHYSICTQSFIVMHTEAWLNAKWKISFLNLGSTKLPLFPPWKSASGEPPSPLWEIFSSWCEPCLKLPGLNEEKDDDQIWRGCRQCSPL